MGGRLLSLREVVHSNILHRGSSHSLPIPYNEPHEFIGAVPRKEVIVFFTLFIFVLAYIMIASEKFPRHWVALLGGGLLIAFGVMSPSEAFSYINWETLGLLAGMFLLVSILQEAGFFSWLAMKTRL